MKRIWVAFAAFALAVCAQYPGQYPPGGGYPGGSPYPGGRYPGNDPSQRRPPRTSPGSPSKRGGSKETPIITTTFGMLRRYSPQQLVIEADDHRIVWFRVSSDTKFEQKDGSATEAAKWQPGDQISVDSTEDPEGRFTAVTVKFDKPGLPKDRAEAARTWDLPRAQASSPSSSKVITKDGDERPRLRRNDPEPKSEPAAEPVQTATAQSPAAPAEEPAQPERPATTMRPPDAQLDDDDPGRPVLRRGIPKPRPQTRRASTSAGESSSAPAIMTQAPAAETPVAPPVAPPAEEPKEDELIAKARAASAEFSTTLPNFFCNQSTTRYQTNNPKRGWDPVDMVTAEVTYEDGREDYKNIKVNGKPAKGSMIEIGGSASTGEFGTILRDLFSPSTAADFRRSGTDSISGRDAVTFKFDVPRERSHWRVEGTSQLYYPAYKGSLWIDRETGRVLRIEMQGRQMPQLFSFDTVETAVDYAAVRLGTAQSFLLPVNAEMLSCQRGSNYCSRNKIEFRNYKKYGAESDVTFTDVK